MNEISKILKNKVILEIGCNTGLITLQIAKYYPKKIVAFDNNQEHLYTAKKINNFFFKKKVKFLKINFFNQKDLKKIKTKFDVIILRHILNAFSYEDNMKILLNLKKKIKKNGRFIIIDFYKRIIYRTLFFSFVKLNIRNGIKRYKDSLKENSFLINKKDLKKYFNNNYSAKIYSKDFFNKHESIPVKIINFIFNCTYTAIYKKNDN